MNDYAAGRGARAWGASIAGLAVALLLGGCQSLGPMPGGGGESLTLQKGAMADKGSGAAANLASLNEAVRHNPQDVNALNLRGTAYAQAGKTPEALADFNAALSIDPRFHQAYANRGLLRSQQKQYDEALADYQQALAIDPQYTAAYLGRGRVYMQQQNLALAIADFKRALELDPSNAVAYYQRGIVYQLMNQHDNAVNDFDIAIALRPESPDPYFARGQSRFALQQFELAYDDFYVAAQRGSDGGREDVRAWTYRGLSAEKFGDRKKAARAYERALRVDPSFKPAQEGIRRVGSSAA
jgi:tetratricopeptide (TPR) repeat protein